MNINQLNITSPDYTDELMPNSYIKIIRMTPQDIDNNYSNILIRYQHYDSIYGNVIIASTNIGICYIAFDDNKIAALHNLTMKYKKSTFINESSEFHYLALSIINNSKETFQETILNINGTEFQFKVWDKLLNIPYGKLSTYSKIAEEINSPNSQRAVGTAIGSNPIAYLIPCHRIIQSSGKIGGYKWGQNKKIQIINNETKIIF